MLRVKMKFGEFLGESAVAQAGDVLGEDAGYQFSEDAKSLGAGVGDRCQPFGASGSREI